MLISGSVKKPFQAYSVGNSVACFNKDNIRFVQLEVLITFCYFPWENN